MAKVDPYGQVHYLFADRLGSAWAMTDAQGFYEQIWHYYPYGGKRLVYDTLTDPNTGWWKKNRHRFTGLWRDDETGLYYTWFRMYSPSLGRWLAPDPIAGDVETPGSLNRYTYVLNNPVNFVDPLGLFATPCFGYCPPVAPPSPPYGPSPDPAGYEPPNPYGDPGGCTAPDGQCGGRPVSGGGSGKSGDKSGTDAEKKKDLINAALKHENLSDCLHKFFGPGKILTNANLPRIDASEDLKDGAVGGTRESLVPDTGRATILIDRATFQSLSGTDHFLIDTYLHETANALAIQRFTKITPRWARAYAGARGAMPTERQLKSYDQDIGQQFEECLHKK